MLSLALSIAVFLSLPLLLKGQSYVPSCSATCSCPLNTEYTTDNSVNSTAMPEELVKELIQSTRANTQSIAQLRREFQNKTRTTEAVMNDLLLFVEELLTIHTRNSTMSHLPKSCQEIKQ